MTGKINFLSVIFYYGGIMKRFLSILMCIFILTISLITYFPFSVKAADNDFTLSNEGINLSSGEANNAVKNKGDIYTADHLILFRYTPTSDYNWTYVNQNIHLSDAQVVALLMSDNKYEVIAKLAGSAASHSVITRGMLAALGVLTTGDSDIFNSFFDMLTSNYNYLNAIQYDPNTGDLTLLADQVAALREELKSQYYETIGVAPLISSGTDIKKAVTNLRDCFEFEEDYNDTMQRISDYDYSVSLKLSSCGFCFAFKRDSFNYCYFGSDNLFSLNFVDNDLNIIELPYVYLLNQEYIAGYNVYSFPNIVKYSTVSSTSNGNRRYFTLKNFAFNVHYNSDSTDHVELYKNIYGSFYNSSNSDFLIFNSYESLYNYVHGSQNAYLSSKVQEAGEDIKLSINDMNDNIGSKIDDLIDSINNKKEGMSADELQKAIDDALASISGKLDDIGDNTNQTNNKLDALLESVSGTNQILMQILGVTTDIRDIVKTKDEEGNQYTMSDVKNCFNTMFNNLKYSILYGKNVTNNPDAANVSTAAYVSYSDVCAYADTSAETLDYKDGLLGKFPFSVPYQMYEWLQVLQVDEKVPSFNYNYGFLIGQKGKQEYDLTFNLTQYQPWADVLKSFLRLSFTLIMSVFIYNKFKGEM